MTERTSDDIVHIYMIVRGITESISDGVIHILLLVVWLKELRSIVLDITLSAEWMSERNSDGIIHISAWQMTGNYLDGIIHNFPKNFFGFIFIHINARGMAERN